MNTTDTTIADRANAVMRKVDDYLAAAREACDAAARQDNIPDSIAADFARCAARQAQTRDDAYTALGISDNIDYAESLVDAMQVAADDIDNQLVAADVMMA